MFLKAFSTEEWPEGLGLSFPIVSSVLYSSKHWYATLCSSTRIFVCKLKSCQDRIQLKTSKKVCLKISFTIVNYVSVILSSKIYIKLQMFANMDFARNAYLVDYKIVFKEENKWNVLMMLVLIHSPKILLSISIFRKICLINMLIGKNHKIIDLSIEVPLR